MTEVSWDLQEDLSVKRAAGSRLHSVEGEGAIFEHLLREDPRTLISSLPSLIYFVLDSGTLQDNHFLDTRTKTDISALSRGTVLERREVCSMLQNKPRGSKRYERQPQCNVSDFRFTQVSDEQ